MSNESSLEKIEEQKKHYKLGVKSICRNCIFLNDDCFEAMKNCEKDEKTGNSWVRKCSWFANKNPIEF